MKCMNNIPPQKLDSIWNFYGFATIQSTLPLPINLKKRVSFCNIATVILIPTRYEYQHLRSSLWYTSKDYDRFKISIINDGRVLRV